MILQDILEIMIVFSDDVLPRLQNSAEQAIAMQLFARTLAVGKQDCSIHFDDLSCLTGASDATLRRALNGLIDKGIIEILDKGNTWRPRTYRFNWPLTLPPLPQANRETNIKRLARDPAAVIQKLTVQSGPQPADILNSLPPEELDNLAAIEASLSEIEMSEFRIAASRQLSPGDDLQTLIRSMIAQARLGPAIIEKCLRTKHVER